MDAIELLEEQHRDVEDLLEEIDQAAGPERRDLFEDIADQLTVHTLIEERHFYPAVQAVASQEQLDTSVQEHRNIKQLITALLRTDVEDEAFESQLQELKRQVAQHVDEEEAELFPRVRQTIDAARLEALALEMNATQERLMDAGDPRDLVGQPLSDAAAAR